MSDPTIIARSVEKTNLWLDELANELGTHDRKAHVTQKDRAVRTPPVTAP